jgi:hypothetical protein
VPLASDELSAERAADTISHLMGRRFDAAPVPTDELPPGLRVLFGWLADVGHKVDIDSLRSRYPDAGWQRYGDWARSQRSRLRDLCAHPPTLTPTA